MPLLCCYHVVRLTEEYATSQLAEKLKRQCDTQLQNIIIYTLQVIIIKYQQVINMKIQIPASKVMSSGAFTIYESHVNGRTWVIPAWIEVPVGTKQSDIELTGRKLNVASAVWQKYSVNGSKGKIYTVIIDEFKKASCTCIGFGYHRTCKHIAQVTEK